MVGDVSLNTSLVILRAAFGFTEDKPYFSTHMDPFPGENPFILLNCHVNNNFE